MICLKCGNLIRIGGPPCCGVNDLEGATYQPIRLDDLDLTSLGEEEAEENERLTSLRASLSHLVLPTDCPECSGRGCVGHETNGPCEVCNGWTSKKRAIADFLKANWPTAVSPGSQ